MLRPLEEGDEPDDSLDWSVGIVGINEESKKCLMMGDLLIEHEGWMVGATALVGLSFRDKTLVRGKSAAELTKVYGPWVAHLLWDYVAAEARALVAKAIIDLEVPYLTPPTHFSPMADFAE